MSKKKKTVCMILLESVTVHSRENIVFTFRGGTELDMKIE